MFVGLFCSVQCSVAILLGFGNVTRDFFNNCLNHYPISVAAFLPMFGRAGYGRKRCFCKYEFVGLVFLYHLGFNLHSNCVSLIAEMPSLMGHRGFPVFFRSRIRGTRFVRGRSISKLR